MQYTGDDFGQAIRKAKKEHGIGPGEPVTVIAMLVGMKEEPIGG